MIVSRRVYDDMVTARIRAEEQARAFQESNKGLQVTLDWLRVRVTQIEKERAIMIERFMGVKIPVPEIMPAPDPFESHPLNNMGISFEGMSDAEAEKQGVGYDGEGHVTYKK